MKNFISNTKQQKASLDTEGNLIITDLITGEVLSKLPADEIYLIIFDSLDDLPNSGSFPLIKKRRQQWLDYITSQDK